MSQASAKRTSLLIGCGSAALALSLALGTAPASAQGIQATGNVTFGSANINDTVPGQTTVSVSTGTTVIDWTPILDNSGNALPFLPTSNTALFQNNAAAQISQFAVLNRILPDANGNIAVINGNVISRIVDFTGGSAPGGFVAFYSPTGILVGSTASFDVGRLMLTTLDTSPASFDLFAQAGFGLQLQGAQGSTARISIAPGAQILATPENAFFAVVAADVEMRGTARINGSHAYVAGEVVNLSFSNGLFNIQVPVGTGASGEVMTLDGNVGGPSSTGVSGDSHLIYAVARASSDPISMLFRGNLGFDPAQSAGVINGEIIISANHDVFGRFVDGDSISSGVNARFDANSALTDVRADIAITDATVTGDLLAIGTHAVTASAIAADSSFFGNLLLVGRESATLRASGGNAIAISGDVLVDAQDFGVSNSGLQSLDVINAQGGAALIEANAGSTITVSGAAVVAADATAGAETIDRISGFARGGSAAISANGGSIDVAGGAQVSARARGSTLFNIAIGAEARGGSAEVRASGGGSITLQSGVAVLAGAAGAQGSLQSPSSLSDAFGGNARIAVRDGGGTITIGANALLDAQAFGGSANAAGAGSVGDGGEATVSIQDSGLITIASGLQLDAGGSGGLNAGGTGGTGLGGRATILTQNGGTIDITGSVGMDALGLGGAGQTGGNGLGGIAGAQARIGAIAIEGLAAINANGSGGDASFGFGGVGGDGRGGNAFLQADGTLTQTASLSLTDLATLSASGFGGTGGGSDGQAFAPGRGGNGFGGDPGVPNQADPSFGSGVFVLGGGDNGRLNLNGVSATADGAGGDGGGAAGLFVGGTGGDGFGGLAQIGLALLGQNGSVGLGRADLGAVFASVNGTGGRSGLDGNDNASGIGGNGQGGLAALTLRAGDVLASTVDFFANGTGGEGATAGTGTGGEAAVLGSLGGTLVATGMALVANGSGGLSDVGTGGAGTGGVAEVEVDGTTITINGDLTLEANGSGGNAADGAAGNGFGGEAYIGQVQPGGPGVLNVTGHTALFANGTGADSASGFAAGNGQGGHAWIRSSAGATKTFGSVQLTAIGRGGSAQSHEGGNGTGGLIELISTGTGSRITIARNVPASAASNSPGGFTMLNANGIGALTNGGDGIGGIGRGGTILVSAALGGAVNLPLGILADPARAADQLFMVARGTGGDSAVDGGTGGAAYGGNFTLQLDGGTLSSDAIAASVLAQGGGSADPALAISGGDAFGGSYAIRAVGGSTLTLDTIGGGADTQGGSGSGNGNGGNATAGAVLFEVINSTANLAGAFTLRNSAGGGSGQRGGNALGGTVTVNAANAAITLSTSPTSGDGFLVIDSAMNGGEGIVAGGDASGNLVNVTLNATSLTGGALSIMQSAAGGFGAGAGATGGNATGATVEVRATGSTLSLVGPLAITASALGGDSGVTGIGGSGQGGQATLALTDTALTLATGPQGAPASLDIRADGDGGLAGTIGNGSGGIAKLDQVGGSINAARVLVSAQGFSSGLPDQTGSAASGGAAALAMDGAATLDATTVTIIASADAASGGSARGGSGELTIAPGSTATLTAGSLSVAGDALSGDPATVQRSGRFLVDIRGGNVNVGNFLATAIGNAIDLDPVPSRLNAVGGNLNVTNSLIAAAFHDLFVEYGAGGIIGSTGTGQTATQVQIDSNGTLSIDGDGGSTGGLGGQFVDLLAGRSLLVNGNITGAGGVRLTANIGDGAAFAQPGLAEITMAQGTRINGGTGVVSLFLLDGFSDPQRQTGAVTLANITADTIVVRNAGSSAGSDIRILADGVLSASGTERAIDLASLNGEVINLHGDAGLDLTGGGYYSIFAATPTGSQIGSLANYQRFYNVADEAAYLAASPGSNYAAFRIAPVLTVTANDIARFYGNANPAFTANITGFFAGDSIADLTGALQFLTGANAASPIGQYVLDVTQGTLVSPQGYQFTFAPGILTVTPRPITITANNLSRIYGNANPALTFTVGGQGLVNGDQLGGALATSAGLTSGVGNYAITQGTLAASNNYAVTFVGGQLTVTPRPVTITADSFARVYGNANPALTFSVGGQGLVNGDQLTGALATTAGLATGVGSYAITQGTLSAGANYTITYNAGVLSISPRPITITADNLSRTYGNANPALTFAVGGQGLVNGDQLSGALATTAGVATGIGSYAITQGTLTAGANYTVTYNAGALSITPRPITITANNLSRIYGNANPALTFTVGGQGLVNGDQLTGALATAAGPTTGIGTSAITIGTLAATPNYTVTFVPGVLTITPRPLTVAADNVSKTFGLADPLLTFLITSGDLVNGDRLSGALVRDPGEAIATFVIRQGTLSAGDNYTLTFVPGTFTINPPPVSPEINNPTTFQPPLVIDSTPPPVAGEVEQRFGIDFPEQPDAPLISEDPLLDEPVASGGDSSVYGAQETGGTTPPAGGQ